MLFPHIQGLKDARQVDIRSGLEELECELKYPEGNGKAAASSIRQALACGAKSW